MHPIRISVAMATFNGQAYLQQQLESLARQTRRPFELVICDDASSDGTAEVVARFAPHAPFPIRFHRNPANLGYSDNFFRAMAMCEGDWIALCDQDDVWQPHKLERLAAAMAQPDVLALMHTGEVVDAALRPRGYRVPLMRRSEVVSGPWGLAQRFFPAGFAMAVSAELVKAFAPSRRPRDYRLATDRPIPHDLWLYMLARAMGSVVHLAEPLVLYRQHQTNTCGAPSWSLKGEVGAALTTGEAHYRRQAAIASEYAATFSAFAAEYQPRAAALHTAAAFYEALAVRLASRAVVYDQGRPRSARLKALGERVAAGCYARRREDAASARALVKDALVALAVLPVGRT